METDLKSILPNKNENVVILTDDTPRSKVHRLNWHNAQCIMCDMIELLIQRGVRNFIYRGTSYADYKLIDQLARYRQYHPGVEINIWVCGYSKWDRRYKRYNDNRIAADHELLLNPNKVMRFRLADYLCSVAGACDWAISFFHSGNADAALVPDFCNGRQIKTYSIEIDERMSTSIHRFYSTFSVAGI